VVSDDDSLTAELARFDREGSRTGERVLTVFEYDRKTAAVDSHHHSRAGIFVAWSLLATGARLLFAGSDANVVLVEVTTTPSHAAASPIMSCQRRVNSGNVLSVVAMFSTCIPATRNPTSAPVVAMRWSA
jgi:hypothetical protein